VRREVACAGQFDGTATESMGERIRMGSGSRQVMEVAALSERDVAENSRDDKRPSTKAAVKERQHREENKLQERPRGEIR
jgi:hypothetical protein